MPGMDGITLGRIIKNDARLKNITLVMLTSAAQKRDANSAKMLDLMLI